MVYTFRYDGVLLALVRAWSVQKGWSGLPANLDRRGLASWGEPWSSKARLVP